MEPDFLPQSADQETTLQLEAGILSEESKQSTASSKVFSRELYAQKDFWNDRFAESKGHFDWYANWKEIKPVFKVRVTFQMSYIFLAIVEISSGSVWQRTVPNGWLRQLKDVGGDGTRRLPINRQYGCQPHSAGEDA